MLVRTQEIIEYIADYIQQKSQEDGIWHIGICQEAHDIIFEALKKSSQYWMYIETDSHTVAKEVLGHFVKTGKAREDKRNTQTNSIDSVIYVYKKQRILLKKE
jgi:hypothetical protein